MTAIAVVAQALDLWTWLAWVGPEREGNPGMAMPVEYVVAAKVIAVLTVVGICYWRRLRLPLTVAAAVGIVGAASNVGAAL